MLTKEGCRQRCARLWQNLQEPLDWIVLHEPQHLTYFAGFYADSFTFATQNAGAVLILGADGSSHLIADNLQGSCIEKAHYDSATVPTWYRSVESAPYRTELLVRTAKEVMAGKSGDRIGYEPATPAGLLEELRSARPSATFTDVSPLIFQLRRAKDPDEMVLLRSAISVAEAGFSAAIQNVRPGMTEMQMYELVANAVMERAQDRVIVYGDFASGDRVFQGGGAPTQRVIEQNDLILLDFSAVIFGYRGDFANAFVVAGGKPTEKQKEYASYCRSALEAGENCLRAGMECKQIDSAIRTKFRSFGVDHLFTHHSGHGLGLGHPDAPYIVPESTDTLIAGDVVTLEPGLYLAGEAGGRFERNYLITETGFELLSFHHIGLEPPR